MRKAIGRQSRLPAGGGNVFLAIKQQREAARAKGIDIIDMSVGQPSGAAFECTRKEVARVVQLPDETVHEYQDNGSPGCPGFARDFVHAHFDEVFGKALDESGAKYIPTPGTKAMLKLVIMACGGYGGNQIVMRTMTDPGYPTPATWAGFLNQINTPLPTNMKNEFLFSVDDIAPETDLLMLNFPNNPSGQGAPLDWLKGVCERCEKYNIRVMNDAAYGALSHDKINSRYLIEAAVNFKKLSYLELFSSSKSIGNGTGHRAGAVCGSPDFVDDFARMKGEDDSGGFAPAFAGALAGIRNKDAVELNRKIYEIRMDMLISTLQSAGMKLAISPKATFFTFWVTPKKAFGKDIKSSAHFNELMISKAGIVSVPVGPYTRYAVVKPIEKVMDRIAASFKKARISY